MHVTVSSVTSRKTRSLTAVASGRDVMLAGGLSFTTQLLMELIQ